ncbi:MAG: extracellular solute-binding protein [Coriobacteriia bacterium]|nr:extracellular solute-binding protein [Coriobacteriia bacterium]MCL2870698.1 extracellular solute-binding protein [Coriobacteriia bacterium]
MFDFSRTKKRIITALGLAVLIGLLLTFAACTSKEVTQSTDESVAPVETTNLVLASTTSTQDSGLFDALIPAFEEAHPEVNVQVIAVGSGEAMEMGRRGDADLLLVHSPAAEIEFMEEGYGLERKPVMYNDFIVIGSADDPATIADSSDAAEAFTLIAQTESTFISRGDDSGTHAREMSIWDKAEITPEGDWYQETGQGMGATLQIAEEFQAYTLTDRATYLNLNNEDVIELPILSEGSDELLNFYHVITLVDAREQAAAQAFADWIVNPAGQEVIASFGVEEFGAPLFTPNADE